MSLKYNPFKPNDMIHSGMFVGRVPEIKAIERCIFQTKNGNPQHFIVQGERGIGKSSLLLLVQHISRGNVKGLLKQESRFLTVFVDLGGCSSTLEVIQKIGRGLRSELAMQEQGKAAAKAFYDWLTNWEILGSRYHKETGRELDEEELSEELVRELARFCQGTDMVDGVVLLIDEADGPDVSVGLGAFVKMLTERLTRQGCTKVLLGLAGLPTLLQKLRDSHESSPRLFETFTLRQLDNEECKRAVRQGLDDANSKNAVQTTIEPDALDLLAKLSEGFPHFIQQFAYCAFEEDEDDCIDLSDVGAGAEKALSQLGDKFFSDMYHARISSDDYRRVLDAMAAHGDDWVARKDLIEETNVKTTKINNALASLKKKQIILADDSRPNQGFYRLPTRSFAAWINAYKATKTEE